MKKFLMLILICCAQNLFSQTEEPKRYITDSERAVIKENQVYNTAGIEVKPDFPGGMEKLYKFIDNNFRYPKEEGINLKGKKVYVTFIVEKDGSLSDIKVLRDVGYGSGAEAIRILKKCPKWNPGQQNGRNVRVLYPLPIIMK